MHWSPTASRREPSCSPGAPTRHCSTGPPCWPTPDPASPPTTRRCSARSLASRASRHSTKPWSWPQTPNTVSRWASSPPMSLPDSPWPSAFPPAPRTSTTRRCATTRTCPSAGFATRATHLASAPPQPTSRPTPTPDGSPFSPRLLPILSDPDDNERLGELPLYNADASPPAMSSLCSPRLQHRRPPLLAYDEH